MKTNELVLSDKQILGDKLATTIIGAIAALVTSSLVDKGYRSAITRYRVHKITA